MRRLVVVVLGAAALVFTACTPPTTGGGGGTTNHAPLAAISADPTTGYAPMDVQFSSAGSSDDTAIVSYSWDFGDGSATDSTPNPAHRYEAAGTFTAKVTVTDGAGLTDDAAITVIASTPPNTPPEAHAAADVTNGKAPFSVQFSSTGTTDSDGTVESLAWEFGDGGTSTDADPAYVYATPGSYVASLTATDDDGDSNTATVSITVLANQPPTASAACTPVSGKVPLTVSCTSAGSDDLDGSVEGYVWTFGDGGTSTDADPTYTFTTASTTPYDVTLTVTDDDGDNATDVATVTVNANQGPTAVANGTPLSGTAPMEVVFDGSLSSDLDGGIAGYAWNFGDGATSTDVGPTHTYTTSGTHVATLTVADAEGLTDSATVTVVVDNTAPTAAVSCDPTAGKAPLDVDCTSDGSTDADGSIASYSWDFGDGATATGPDAGHSYDTPGDYTVTLTVTDNDTATATASTTVHALANVAPTAVAAGDPLVGREELEVSFSAAGSGDEDGTISTYSWDFGDGGSSTSANPSHTYTDDGTYTAELTVTDDSGDTATDSVVVTVNENQAPTAVANATVQTGPTPFAVPFTGSDSVDPDARSGEVLDYSWDFGDGGSSSSANPSHTYTASGDHVATLTVTDANGATDSAQLTIHVLAFTDIDGDGYAVEGNGTNPGIDCRDDDPAINPGAADAFDSLGTDTNCDGVDGIAANAIFVATTGADSPTCGALGSACATVGQGVTRATAAAKPVLNVASGSYSQSVSLNSALTIRGGYSSDFATRSGTTTVTGVGGPAFTAANATGAIVLLDLTANGAPGSPATGVLVSGTSNVTLTRTTVNSGAATGTAASAYGVRAISGATVSITDSTVTAAAATAATASTATGSVGSAGCLGIVGFNHNASPDNAGGPSCGGVAGSTLSGAGGAGTDGCSALLGCTGPPGVAGSTGGAGAAGGVGGTFACVGSTSNPGKGGTGGAATAGGTAGSSGSGIGSAGTTWLGSPGGTGGTGGSGGGGGGAGGGAGTCASSKGGGGGSGGGGGTGGNGGGGGSAGGGSFAVYAFNATVTVTGSSLTANAGGAGGQGATGGQGGAGRNGGNGGATDTGLQAGSGGGGGGGAAGSGGGGGGGGAGGPSIAALQIGTGSLTITTSTLNKAASAAAGGGGGAAGTAGAGSTGGTGGASNGGNTGTSGTAGAAGNVGIAGTAGASGLRCSSYIGSSCTP